MNGASLSCFPHLSWLRFRVVGDTAARPLVVTMHGVCHTLSLTVTGHHDIRWINRGRERRWGEDSGTVHFLPADDEHHTFLTTMSRDLVSLVLLLPREHLRNCAVAEGCESPCEAHRLLAPHDPILQTCITRIGAVDAAGDAAADERLEESARRLVLRIVELTGGGRPDWHDDASQFGRRALVNLVEIIDSRLENAPTLCDLASHVGLSPSHFAKKFRQTTGLSLYRFINRRRILRALESLRDQSHSLTRVALDLGFASQSHFTRLFSGLTGMTPAKYRKQFRRTVG